MKIVIASTGLKLDDNVGMRPDKCSHWLIVDPITMEYEAMSNPLMSLAGPGARTFLFRLLQERLAGFILAGCGCSQLKELREDGMRVLLGMTGSVREAVEEFKRNQISRVL